MDESTKSKIAGLLEQAEQEAEQRGYTAGVAAGTEAAKRVTPYEEPGGPYEDNGMEARQVRHRLLWERVSALEGWEASAAATRKINGELSDRITELEAEVARLQGLVPAVMPETIQKPKKGGSK